MHPPLSSLTLLCNFCFCAPKLWKIISFSFLYLTYLHPTLYFSLLFLPLLARLKSGPPASLAHTCSLN